MYEPFFWTINNLETIDEITFEVWIKKFLKIAAVGKSFKDFSGLHGDDLPTWTDDSILLIAPFLKNGEVGGT